MDENKHIDDLFSRKLRDFMKDPPAEVWDSVSVSLKHQKRILLFPAVWRIAAGIAILFMFGLGWYLINNRIGDSHLMTAEEHSTNMADEYPKESELYSSEKKINEYPKESELYSSEKKINDKAIGSLYESKEGIIADADITSDNDFPAGTVKIYGQSVQNDREFIPYTDQGLQENILFSPLFWSVPAHVFVQITPPAAKQESLTISEKQNNLENNLLTLEFPEAEIQKSPDEGRWLLSGMAAPEYSYRTVNMDDMAFTDYFNNSENAVFTWSGGVQIGYKASSRLNIQTGLLFSRSGIQIDQLSTFGKFNPERFANDYSGNTMKAFVNTGNSIGSINTSASNVVYMSYNSTDEQMDRANTANSILNTVGFTSSITGLDADLIQYFDFIELPVNLRYRLNSGKMQFNLLGGVSSNLLVGTQVIFTADGEREKTGKTDNIRTVNYSGNFGLSVDYDISDHFMLLFEPRYKYYLHSINKNDLINAKPYLIGIFTGFRYKF